MAGRMSDEAVKAKTGKTWAEWGAILDRAGGRKLTHQQIVAYLHQEHGLGPWWRQMVTVGYEQERGLRQKHEKPDGFQISRSLTLAVPVSTLFKAFSDKRQRGRWLADPGFEVRTVTTDRSLRANWVDGKSTLEVMFYPRGESRCQVTVQHNKLASAKAAERMKAYWGENLQRLRELLAPKA